MEIQGLTTNQADESRAKNGSNALTQKAKKTFLKTYIDSFKDPIIIVLLVALSINLAFTFMGKVDLHECAGIMISVILSTFVSSLSEYSNENAFLKLQNEALKTRCKVYRDNKLAEISINEIVVGDKVLLQSGDMIPADGEIINGSITVNQSTLNGENQEAEKTPYSFCNFNDFLSKSALFRGSIVCSGEAVMCVKAVGDATVYGRLTEEAQEDSRESPLSIKLKNLAKSISRFGCISAILVVLISFINDAFLNNHLNPILISQYFSDTALVCSDLVSALIIGIIVVVVAVPDGLPLMIAIVCSLNMKKMLKSNVLVRKLVGIETAGGINILFTDKTGTITRGKPKVLKLIDADGREFSAFSALENETKELFKLSCIYNSSAKFSGNNIIGGNATEKALLEFLGRQNFNFENGVLLNHLPFSSDKKYSMAYINKKITLIKGAPEIILPHCTYNKVLNSVFDELSKKTMRLIAIAYADGKYNTLPDKMNLVGVIAIRDEIRPEAKSAIADVKRAGIQVVMITGDKKETAEAIARESGLLSNDGIILTSNELCAMTDNHVKKILPRLSVVARALPSDKSRLVRLSQSLNMVVGMTGDGVNDAPALKLADVGFAMGGGAEAAAAAADIVILDDNFRSIRNAVLYGRTIYNSIKKFIKFQLTINVAAVAVSILGPIVNVEKPLDISQMIWTNLMIDSLAAIAFGGEPALKSYMLLPPRRRDENLMDKKMWSAVIINSLYISALSLLFFISPVIRNVFRTDASNIYFYSGYFAFFIFISVFNAFNTRSDGIDLFEKISLNKLFLIVMLGILLVQILMIYFGGALLRTAGLTMKEWMCVLSLALTIFPVDLIRKIIMH